MHIAIFALFSILLQCLFVYGNLIVDDDVVVAANILRLAVQENDQIKHVHHLHTRSDPLSHMADHMDPSSKLFLHIGDLKLGNNLPLYFANLKQPKFLPKEKADSIPFSTEKLPQLLQLFSFQPETPQAQAMEATLKRCDSKPVEGEAKFCATSSESMFHFIRVILGLDTDDIKVLSSSHLTESNIAYQNYTLMGFEEYLVKDAVGCHSVPYPYTVYYCHFIDGSEARVFNILLQGGTDGAMVKSVVVCHMDTSQWDPEHVSFQVLGTQPGKFSPVCHIFPESDILSIPVTSVIV